MLTEATLMEALAARPDEKPIALIVALDDHPIALRILMEPDPTQPIERPPGFKGELPEFMSKTPYPVVADPAMDKGCFRLIYEPA